MRKIYVAHPLRGDGPNDIALICKNMTAVDEICRAIRTEHPNVLILSPIHAFSFETALSDQSWALKSCAALLTLADELWVFGDWERSEGCAMEVTRAREMGLTIVYADGRIEGGGDASDTSNTSIDAETPIKTVFQNPGGGRDFHAMAVSPDDRLFQLEHAGRVTKRRGGAYQVYEVDKSGRLRSCTGPSYPDTAVSIRTAIEVFRAWARRWDTR